jgi:hypothetical protein
MVVHSPSTLRPDKWKWDHAAVAEDSNVGSRASGHASSRLAPTPSGLP